MGEALPPTPITAFLDANVQLRGAHSSHEPWSEPQLKRRDRPASQPMAPGPVASAGAGRPYRPPAGSLIAGHSNDRTMPLSTAAPPASAASISSAESKLPLALASYAATAAA